MIDGLMGVESLVSCILMSMCIVHEIVCIRNEHVGNFLY